MEIEELNGSLNDKLQGKVLVDFYATWCGPCKAQSEVLKELETDYKIYSLNVDNNHNLTKKYGILSIPTLLIFNNGELIEKKIGFTSREDLLKILK